VPVRPFSVRLSVCLSVRMEKLDTPRIFMKFDI
jgi:hypothetical protein